MKTEYPGIFLNGGVSFDMPLNLPENTRVVVTVAENEGNVEQESIVTEMQHNDPEELKRIQQAEAVRRFFEVVRQTPLHLGGERFNREELYDRP